MHTASTRFLALPNLHQALALIPRIVPSPIQDKLIQSALNRLFSTALQAGQLDFLARRSVRIRVKDMAIEFTISALQRHLQVQTGAQLADITLSANCDAFIDIITARADPDTLFFRRKLAIEGDTELGVALKNFLDTCEPEQLLPAPVYNILQRYAQHRDKLKTDSPQQDSQ